VRNIGLYALNNNTKSYSPLKSLPTLFSPEDKANICKAAVFSLALN
jgi:hypothetical protein